MPDFWTRQIDPPANWQDFESLCCDLWREIWNDPNTQKNGRTGQLQCGVDIFGRPDLKNRWAGIQCKGKNQSLGKKLTKDELKQEVEKAKSFDPELSEYIVATTSPKDVEIEQLARIITDEHLQNGMFSVTVCGWEDILLFLGDYPDIISKHYPNSSYQQPRRDDISLQCCGALSPWGGTDTITIHVRNDGFQIVQVLRCDLAWKMEDEDIVHHDIDRERQVRWICVTLWQDGYDNLHFPMRLKPDYRLQYLHQI